MTTNQKLQAWHEARMTLTGLAGLACIGWAVLSDPYYGDKVRNGLRRGKEAVKDKIVYLKSKIR